MTTRPQDRDFPVFRRGEIREAILSSWRAGLRRLTNPETGAPFTEAEIAAATASGTRWYAQAEADDLNGLPSQQRGLFLADQARPERASTPWLRDVWGPLHEVEYLPAQGGTGLVEFDCTDGTIFVGSSTKPDPTAMYGREVKSGQLFQILFTETAVGTSIQVTMSGISTGVSTNLEVGAEILLGNGPLSVTTPGRVVERFTGGGPAETNADFSRRVLAAARWKQGAGNNAQLRALVRASNSSIDDAFVYACALHAGSTIIAIGQKRGTTEGPLARVANASSLLSATIAVSAPASPDVPAPPYVLVVPFTVQYATMRAYVNLPRGKSTGWRDVNPWPQPDLGGAAEYSSVTSPTVFSITTTGPRPTVTAPSMMVWKKAASKWEKLAVQSVVELSPGEYEVTLAEAPSFTFDGDELFSPDTSRRAVIGKAVVDYFDSLGPGEVVDLATDPRAHRAQRFPSPADERVQSAGSGVSLFFVESLGAALSGAVYEFDGPDPAVPGDPTFGPAQIVPGPVGLYPPPL